MGDETKVDAFCLLAKGARGRALADLIQKITSEPNIFAFGELLDASNIAELQGSEYDYAYQLLQLFCYGTWSQYRGSSPERFPKLSAQQEHKLKQLTVVSMAQTSKTIPYDDLMRQLEISNVREVEDLIISDCFYPRLVKGKLDQQRRLLHVEEAVGRDVRLEQLPDIMAGVTNWLQTSKTMLSTIEAKISWAQSATEANAKKHAEKEAAIEETKDQIKLDADARNAQDAMLLDDAAAATLEFMEEDRTGGRPKRRR